MHPIAALAVAALLVWLIAASAAPWDDVTAGPQTGAALNVQRAEVVHLSILARWRDVIAFLVDVHNWTTWAPWIRSVRRSSAGDWTLDTGRGTDEGSLRRAKRAWRPRSRGHTRIRSQSA